jgi:DNA-binding transcriptional LysR family regulator
MIDWDDVRYFLAVARGGSVRAAAEGLGVNHSTVLRRIAQLEERLGVHMFEKLPSGYRLTAAGDEVLEFADLMEASSHQLETRVFGRDQSVRGLLRVTLAPPSRHTCSCRTSPISRVCIRTSRWKSCRPASWQI